MTEDLDFWGPALLVPMRNMRAPREIIAMQRIALEGKSPSDVRARKHNGHSIKIGKAPFAGTAAMLGWPSEGILGVCEGFETAIGILELGLAPVVWAFTGTSGLASLPVIKHVHDLRIFGDHDLEKRGKRAGSEAAMILARRWMAKGKSVTHSMPKKEGCDFADIASGDCWPETVGCDFYEKGGRHGR
jgi:hypothetical protein